MKLIIKRDKFNTLFYRKVCCMLSDKKSMIHLTSLPTDFNQYSSQMKINVF